MPRNKKQKLHINQRIEDAYGNKGRVLNPELRDNFARVKMDIHVIKDYELSAIKPITLNKQ